MPKNWLKSGASWSSSSRANAASCNAKRRRLPWPPPTCASTTVGPRLVVWLPPRTQHQRHVCCFVWVCVGVWVCGCGWVCPIRERAVIDGLKAEIAKMKVDENARASKRKVTVSRLNQRIKVCHLVRAAVVWLHAAYCAGLPLLLCRSPSRNKTRS